MKVYEVMNSKKSYSVYSPETIKIIRDEQIKELTEKNIKLKTAFGLKTDTPEDMMLRSLRMYNNSIRSRLRKRYKKDIPKVSRSSQNIEYAKPQTLEVKV
jgi:hypothetical protein